MVNNEDETAADLGEGIANLDLNNGNASTSNSSDTEHLDFGNHDPLAALSQTQYAQRTHALMDLNDRLRQCGLDEFFSLPKIAVVGVQSSGKSSIIEAISEISVPRHSGTCTRCPMEIRLRGPSSAEWTCKVSLNFQREPGRTFHFATTRDRTEVEKILRYAQWMILHPNVPCRDYQSLVGASPNLQVRTEDFSKDSVIVDIVGAPVNITFIDLPGIFQVSDTMGGQVRRENLVDSVRELAIEYLTDRNCFVLLVIHMASDMETQESQALAEQHDPEGNRRIGVLTMADRVQPGTEEQWLKILRNEEHQIRHRYYITRQMTPEQVGHLSSQEGRIQEKTFFSQPRGPWCTVDQNYIGVENLTNALSKRLCEMAENTIPLLKKYVKEELVGVVKELDKLHPPLTTSPQSHLIQLCNQFTGEISKYLEAHNAGYGQLIQAATRVYENLKNKIVSARLGFDIDEVRAADERDEAEEEERATDGQHETENLDTEDVQLDEFAVKEPNPDCISLEYVRNLIRLSRKRELQGHPSWDAVEYLMRFSVSTWETLCLEAFANIRRLLETLLEKLILKYFERFTPLKDTVSIEIAKLLDAVAVNTRASIHSYCEWEKRRPFTQNSVDLIAFKNNTYQQYIQRRQQRSAQNLGNAASGAFMFRMPEHEDYEVELGVIAEVTSYFDICYKRASDVVPMLIETELFEKFSELLGEQLIPNLGITGEGSLERCARLAAEDEQVRFRREELERKRATLEEASVILRSI